MNKWALIIGGSSGIGLATTKKLATSGFQVICVHRDRRSAVEKLQEELAGIREGVHTFNFDATNTEKVDAKLDEIKKLLGNAKIDLLVHSLSRGNLKPLFSKKETPTLSDADMSMTLDAMSLNLLTWTRLLVTNNLFSTPGRIVSLTSAGSNTAWAGYAAVGVAKAALESLSRYLAVELADFQITVNTINAGITDTPSLNVIPESEALKAKAVRSNPYHRMTTPEDVANVVYLLTLPEANWINGSLIHVDGGEHLAG